MSDAPLFDSHQALKQVGRSLAGEDRVEDALRIYARILKENPQDVEAYLFMGDLYLAQDDGETALLFYNQAQQLAPEDRVIAGRIKLAHMERRYHSRPEKAPESEKKEDEPAPAPLLPVTEEEIARAARLMQEVLSSDEPARELAGRLYELEKLLPAILELNVRQARQEGQPGLAAALQDLRERLARERQTASPAVPAGDLPEGEGLPRLLFLSSQVHDPSRRMALAAGALSELGCEVTLAAQFPSDFEKRFDVVIAQAPHGSPELLTGLAACSAAQIPILLDLNQDYELMPLDHPLYERYGLGSLTGARAYTAALLLAGCIITPNAIMARPLKEKGYAVSVIPDGWDRGNPLWEKPSAPRSTLHIGWIGEDCQVDDLLPVRRVLFRILREFPNVNLVFAGDPKALQLFANLPESRRIFLPPAGAEDRPFLLSQMDILIRPMGTRPFYASQSDRLLVEAGVRRIPWVASPLPSYLEWKAGGLIADSQDDWHQHLRQLILDEGMRRSLGQEGRRAAGQREMSQLRSAWMQAVRQVWAPAPEHAAEGAHA